MKRKRSAHAGARPPKRPKENSSQSAPATTPAVDHPVLRRLYPDVCSLRHYVLSRLPGSSKARRRKISQLAQGPADPGHDGHGVDAELGRLLDSTLVGVLPRVTSATREDVIVQRNKELLCFSQQAAECASGSTYKPGHFLQAEVVDFVIWLLFQRNPSRRPLHLLCHGFQRSGPARNGQVQCLPGLVSNFQNSSVETLKGPLWRRLHSLLGEGGDSIIVDLLLDCGIFYPVEGSANNYYQISGIPLSEIKPDAEPEAQALSTREATLFGEDRKPSSITFVRNRMLYARAALNAKGGVRFGMRHIHVLNRFPHLDNEQETIHIMRYIFPRQFGLHNVFTSKVDSRETAMPFKDYTLREKEISQTMQREISKRSNKSNMSVAETEQLIAKWKMKVPKRLRGEPLALVQKLRKLNQKCSYTELLRHYCPVEGIHLSTKPDWRKNPLQPTRSTSTLPAANVPESVSKTPHKSTLLHDKNKPSDNTQNAQKDPKNNNRTVEETCFTDLACPTAHVSAFCRAVVAKVIPHGFWGTEQNRREVMYWIDQFVCLRRFESLSLHQVTQKITISSIPWLQPPGFDAARDRACASDTAKRQELFHEVLYYIFDSFLVPLIRSNFHVTESNVHRNRVFYFRHDVWRMLSEPSLATLKTNMFEEMPPEKANRLLSGRTLGFSKIRLLPKGKGVRVIANLKRRQAVLGRGGQMVLGRSINSTMAGVFGVLGFERSLQPSRFGSSLFSVSDMHPKLTAFKKSLKERGLEGAPLFFAKVDVQSCFDTIPQSRLLAMVESLLSLHAYQTGKHIEVSPLGPLQRLYGQNIDPLPVKRYVPHSGAADDSAAFENLVKDKFGKTKANTVFVNTAMQQEETKDDLMQLLREHVERNVVKIGKRYYRQKRGIPQGSVLSTILCNFFYAEFEREFLAFTATPECLLMRLLDDFCLITTEKGKAERFVETMHRRHGDYGVSVKREKSLASFEVETSDGFAVATRQGAFPYCGVLIDVETLEVSKDRERAERANIADSLTVDMAKVPGQSFHRKTLNAFKIQLQTMYTDTWLNSVQTVLANLHQSFLEAAARCAEYARSLNSVPKARTRHERLLIKTVESLIALACVMLQRRTRNRHSQNVERVRNAISRRMVQWIACKAFETVFQRRQTRYRGLLAWVRRALAASSVGVDRGLLQRAIAV